MTSSPRHVSRLPSDATVFREQPLPQFGDGAAQAAQQQRKAAAAEANQPYGGGFYDNDFSYLNDPWYDGFYPGDALKQLPLPAGGMVDVGGEIRVRYHNEENMRGLGLTGREDDFWLTRLRLFSNYRINDYFRFYGEYLHADSAGHEFTNRPIEINRVEGASGIPSLSDAQFFYTQYQMQF